MADLSVTAILGELNTLFAAGGEEAKGISSCNDAERRIGRRAGGGAPVLAPAHRHLARGEDLVHTVGGAHAERVLAQRERALVLKPRSRARRPPA